jgi:4-diphosphocytidyl-2-C-methyl-D-erythritol kinase
MVITGTEQNKHHLKAFAKINLSLAVGEKRDDGFHSVLTILQTISLHDEMLISHNDSDECSFTSNLNLKWNDENTLFRVVEAVCQRIDAPLGLNIFLKSRIPPGGGMGGASTDAAVLLKYLQRQHSIPDEIVKHIAEEVGSDVPFFLRGGTAIATGRGEVLEFPGDLTGYHVKLALPRVRVSTPTAYALIDRLGCAEELDRGDIDNLHRAFQTGDITRIKELSRNTFEGPVLKAYKEIGVVFDRLSSDPTRILTRLTGSGSCVFNLYPHSKNLCFDFVTSGEVSRSNGA